MGECAAAVAARQSGESRLDWCSMSGTTEVVGGQASRGGAGSRAGRAAALPERRFYTGMALAILATALVGWLLLTFSASATAVFVSTGVWYAGLAKPSWNPPGWIFGPAWPISYSLREIAFRQGCS